METWKLVIITVVAIYYIGQGKSGQHLLSRTMSYSNLTLISTFSKLRQRVRVLCMFQSDR